MIDKSEFAYSACHKIPSSNVLNPHHPLADGDAMAEGFKKENPFSSASVGQSRRALSGGGDLRGCV